MDQSQVAPATYPHATSETIASAISSPAAERIAGQPTALGLTAILKRWLARFVEARDRRAAIQVLRYLDERLPHAREPDRAYMAAVADDLRRSLR